MFLNGAEGNQPELRPASIKGAMRYWWRMLQGEERLADLKAKELAYFGGVGLENKRSPVKLRCRGISLSVNQRDMLPHRQGQQRPNSSPGAAFLPNQEFEIELTYKKEPYPDFYVNLLRLCSICGGLGKRSRRGMGSWKILGLERRNWLGEIVQPYQVLENLGTTGQIVALIHSLGSQNFQDKNNSLTIVPNRSLQRRPWIHNINISDRVFLLDEALKKIGQTTHDLKKKYGVLYEATIGHATSGRRYASPMYTSVLDAGNGKVKIILTELNAVGDMNNHLIEPELRDKFINSLIF
jgi:CRISPR-associated protein Cmr1